MADDPYTLLGIPTPEAEAVGRILQPAAPPRQAYANPVTESLSQYQENQGRNWQAQQDLEAQAAAQRRVSLPTSAGTQARAAAYQKALANAIYEKQVGALMTDLHQLDTGDPEALSHQDEVISKHPISRQALSDPRIANLIKRQAHDNAEMQGIFDKDPAARDDYAKLRADEVAPAEARAKVKSAAQKRADRLWFATGGGDPAEFDSGKYNGPDGMPDKAQMAYAIAEKKRLEKEALRSDDSSLNSTERKLLDKMSEELTSASLDPDNPATKKTEFEVSKEREIGKNSKEDWDAAYELVKKKRDAKKDELAATIRDFEKGGKRIPDNLLQLIGSGAVSAPPTIVTPTAGNVPKGAKNAPITPEAVSAPPVVAPATTPSKPGLSPLSQVKTALKP